MRPGHGARCQSTSKHGGTRRETESKLGRVSLIDRLYWLHRVARDGGISGAVDADDALTGTSATKSGPMMDLFLTWPNREKPTAVLPFSL